VKIAFMFLIITIKIIPSHIAIVICEGIILPALISDVTLSSLSVKSFDSIITQYPRFFILEVMAETMISVPQSRPLTEESNTPVVLHRPF
jgi:hypothetical protein